MPRLSGRLSGREGVFPAPDPFFFFFFLPQVGSRFPPAGTAPAAEPCPCPGAENTRGAGAVGGEWIFCLKGEIFGRNIFKKRRFRSRGRTKRRVRPFFRNHWMKNLRKWEKKGAATLANPRVSIWEQRGASSTPQTPSQLGPKWVFGLFLGYLGAGGGHDMADGNRGARRIPSPGGDLCRGHAEPLTGDAGVLRPGRCLPRRGDTPLRPPQIPRTNP